MKRDMDLIRELLLFTEENSRAVVGAEVTIDDLDNCDENEKLHGHLILLRDTGLMMEGGDSIGSYSVFNLTNSGHDLLDSIRDPKIWRQTKEAGEKVGGWTISILADFAKELIKLQFDKLLSGATS